MSLRSYIGRISYLNMCSLFERLLIEDKTKQTSYKGLVMYKKKMIISAIVNKRYSKVLDLTKEKNIRKLDKKHYK